MCSFKGPTDFRNKSIKLSYTGNNTIQFDISVFLEDQEINF